jgi:hypothetical protein
MYHHRRTRSMPSRFYNPAYWLFGIWAFESMFWTGYWLVALVAAVARYVNERSYS